MADPKMTNAQRKAANIKVNQVKALIAAERKKGVTPENEVRLKELEGLLAEAQSNTSVARQKWEKFKRGLGNLPQTIVEGAKGILEATGATNTPGEIVQTPIYTPEQTATREDLRNYGMQELQQKGNFKPIQDQLSQLIGQNLQQPNEAALQPYQDLLGKQISQSGQAGAPYEQMLQNLLSQNSGQYSFEPIKQNALKTFNEQLIPSLAERFNTFGKGAQSTGAFQGAQDRAASDFGTQLAGLESQYNMKNRQLGQTDIENLTKILGQQQNYGLQGQKLAGNLLGQQQAYGITKGQFGQQQQDLLQRLLGQQQNQNLGERGLGFDVLREGLRSPYENTYKPGTEGWGGQAAQAGIRALLLSML